MDKSILIIDDEPDIRDLYKKALEKEGFLTDVASDGQEGLDKVSEKHYSLVLLDVMMPKVDGLTFLSLLKSNNLQKKIDQIVLLSNLTHDNLMQEAFSYGVKECLVKTDLNPQQLTDKVKELLNK